jgi:hypothetical protein
MVGCGLSYVLLTRDSKNICRTKVYDVPNRITMYVNLIYLTANFRVTTTYTSLNQKCFSVQNSSLFCTQFFLFLMITQNWILFRLDYWLCSGLVLYINVVALMVNTMILPSSHNIRYHYNQFISIGYSNILYYVYPII